MNEGRRNRKLKRMHSKAREVTFIGVKMLEKKERNETRKAVIWHDTGNN